MSTTPSMTPQPSPGGPAAPPRSGSGAKVILWVVGGFVGLGMLFMLGIAVVGFFVVHKAKQAGLDTNLMQRNPGFAVAKMAITANPDVQILSSNDSAGIMMVRDKKTGQVLTLKFDPEKKSMVVTDEHGKTASMQLDAMKNSLVVTDENGKTTTISASAKAGNVEIKDPNGSLKMGGSADKAPSWVPTYPGSNPQSVFSVSDGNEQSGTSGFVTQDSVEKVLSYYASELRSGGMTPSTTTTNSDGKAGGIVSGEDAGKKRTVMVTAASDTDGTHVSVTFSAKP